MFPEGVGSAFSDYRDGRYEYWGLRFYRLGAKEDSPFAEPVIFTYPIEVASRMSRMLREEKGADIVICLSHGTLDMDPENLTAWDQPLTDYSGQLIDGDAARSGVQEVKEWQVLLDFALQHKDEDNDGIAEIPALYSDDAGRFLAEPSRAPWKLAGGTWVTHVVWGLCFFC